MRPPTPRLRINSEDFIDNDTDNRAAGPPSNDLFLPSTTANNFASSSSTTVNYYSSSQSNANHYSGVAVTVSDDNDGDNDGGISVQDLEETAYQSSVTTNQFTNNTAHSYHSHSYHNNQSSSFVNSSAARTNNATTTNSTLDDTLAMLVADSDPHDVSVL